MKTTTTPLPPELQDCITVEIQASNRGGRYQWLAYVRTGIPFHYNNHQERQAKRQAIYSWLRERLNLQHLPEDAYADRTLGQDAEYLLALVLAEGEALDLHTALEEAAAAAARVAPDLPPARVCWRGAGQKRVASDQIARVKKARATLCRLERLQRQAQAVAGTDDHAPAQYVYAYVGWRYFDGSEYPPLYKRWRILKATRQFLFIEPGFDWVTAEEQEWQTGVYVCDELGRRSLRIPREALQSEQALDVLPWNIRRRLHVDRLYLRPEDLPPLTLARPEQTAGPGSDLELLGLHKAPTTLREVKAAFRAKARKVHPDTGGSAEAFRAVSEAYERISAGLQLAGVA